MCWLPAFFDNPTYFPLILNTGEGKNSILMDLIFFSWAFSGTSMGF